MEFVAPVPQALAEVDRQMAEYRTRRAADPSQFGPADGCMDGTREHGPAPLVVIYLAKAPHDYRCRLFWCVHKHSFAMEFHYCFGSAWDSRGERTDPQLGFDIRDLPKKYIGRFRIDTMRGCDRRAHQTIIARACADGFDFASICWAREEAAAAIKQAIAPMELDDNEVPF